MRIRANKPVAEARALDLLRYLHVREPDQINLELIAAAHDVFIDEADMDGCEARIVRYGERALITVGSDTTQLGRRRFSIAHELGHFFLHPDTLQLALCSAEDMHCWGERFRPEETEANTFAAELLMPRTLIIPRANRDDPGFALVSSLAEEFQTSLTASAVQFVKYTSEPCALVASEGGRRKWWAANDRFSQDFRIATSDSVHPYTGAHELQEAGIGTVRDKRMPAGAWLDHYSPDGKEYLTEDSVILGSYGTALSLLWIHEDI